MSRIPSAVSNTRLIVIDCVRQNSSKPSEVNDMEWWYKRNSPSFKGWNEKTSKEQINVFTAFYKYENRLRLSRPEG